MTDPSETATVPSVTACFRLMELHGMLPNIREHSVVVAAVASLIARPLSQQGLPIDINTVVAGALLHDIGKTPSLANDHNHARVGADICRNHGLATMALIVEQHIVLRNFQLQGALTEAEIVFYADKRVNHDQVVDLEDRQHYILERYGSNNPERRRLIKQNFQVYQAVEQKIFALLPFGPDEVARRARQENIQQG
jgi:putative nucleotidyltransferase with HDIG domain